jgi:hypothetical protein
MLRYDTYLIQFGYHQVAVGLGFVQHLDRESTKGEKIHKITQRTCEHTKLKTMLRNKKTQKDIKNIIRLFIT